MSINFAIALADRFAAAKAAHEAATEALDALKAEIKAAGIERHIGLTCDVILTLSEQRRVDTKLLQALLTDEQIEGVAKKIVAAVEKACGGRLRA